MASLFSKHLYIGPEPFEKSNMLKIRRTLPAAWLWLCVLASAAPTSGGAAGPSGFPFIVNTWNKEQGLPDGEVISVVQTRDGYLWLGTLHGLVRFDGSGFTIFDSHNTPGLGSGRIVRLFEDSHTNFWVGTDTAGVALIGNGTLTNFSIGRSGHEGRLTSIGEDSGGAVWFYTADAHLGRYQNGKMDILDLHFTAPAIARMIAVEKSGPVWIAEFEATQTNWLYSFQPANFNPPTLAINQPIPTHRPEFILASPHGGIWRLADGRVQKWLWNSNQPVADLGAYPWGSSPVQSACEDSEGNLIVGTLGAGVFWYEPDGKSWQISTNQNLSSPFVLSLCLDRGGNLWVGTDGGGLNRIKRKFFHAPEGLRTLAAQSVSEDNLGGLWTAFNYSGASYWRTNVAEDFGREQGLDPNTWAVLVDHEQKIWVGTQIGGLFQFQTNHFQPAPHSEILGPRIFALFEDHRGQLWAGTQNGLANWDGQRWKRFTTSDGLSGNVVRAIAEATNGDLWIGTENQGLNCFKDGKFISIQASEDGLLGQRHFLSLRGPGRRLVGRHGRTRTGAVCGWKMDPVFDRQRPGQQFHLLPARRCGGQFVAGLQHGPDADSKKTAERFCRRDHQFVCLPDLHGIRWPADARMHGRFATGGHLRPGWHIVVSHHQGRRVGESGGTQTQFAAAGGSD